MNIDKNKILKYFDSTAGISLLSQNKIYNFFDSVVAYQDRAMVDKFCRKELKRNPIEDSSFVSILPGMYEGTDDIATFVIPEHVKSIAQGAFKNSSIVNIIITDGALNNEVDLDVFMGMPKLESIVLPDNLVSFNAVKIAKQSNNKFTLVVNPDSFKSAQSNLDSEGVFNNYLRTGHIRKK